MGKNIQLPRGAGQAGSDAAEKLQLPEGAARKARGGDVTGRARGADSAGAASGVAAAAGCYRGWSSRCSRARAPFSGPRPSTPRGESRQGAS